MPLFMIAALSALLTGALPETPVLAVSGGEVFLEVAVAADGSVGSIRTLRTTPPFTDALIAAVKGWRFAPADAGPVFVAATFAPPALNVPTLGEPPQDIQPASDDTPMPTATASAAYPPLALGDGAVLIDAIVDSTGAVTATEIVASSPAFDAAALGAARSWIFRPALKNGRPIRAHAYLVFAFRQPVTGR